MSIERKMCKEKNFHLQSLSYEIIYIDQKFSVQSRILVHLMWPSFLSWAGIQKENPAHQNFQKLVQILLDFSICIPLLFFRQIDMNMWLSGQFKQKGHWLQWHGFESFRDQLKAMGMLALHYLQSRDCACLDDCSDPCHSRAQPRPMHWHAGDLQIWWMLPGVEGQLARYIFRLMWDMISLSGASSVMSIWLTRFCLACHL